MSKEPAVQSHLPVCCQPSTHVNDLEPPIFSNPVLGVVGADIGLGARHLQPYLLVTLSRWTGLSIGDTFEIYAQNSVIPLASDFVRSGEETNSFFRLVIEEERFPLGLTFPVFSRVVRNGPGTPSTSDNLTVFAKVERPGLDEQPGLGYHDKLQLSLPADLAGPGAVLTPERAALGVTLTIDYPGKRVRDKVYLYWDTILNLVIFELDDEHAEGLKPIEVEVPPAIIGTGSGLISIRYQVFDEVENRSGHVEHFSQAVNLLAELDPSLLERAYFQVNFMDATTVNYDEEAGSNFRVEVVTPRRLPDGSVTPAGARIVVTLSCTRADSSTFTVELPDALVNPGRSSFFNVDEDIIKQLVQGSMKITWRLDFPLGTSIATSQSLTVLISGTIANMPAVNVVQALGGVVDPSEPFVTVEYPNPSFTPYDPGYLVTLCMEAYLPGGGIVSYEVSHIAGDPPPPTRFRTVSNAIFSRFIGLGPVRVFYKVDDGVVRLLGAGTQTVRESESTFVEFGPRLAEMPRPEIDRVDDQDNLDPRDLFGQLDITLPYLRTAPGDLFQWRLVGSAPTGSTNGEIRLSTATAGRPVLFSLDRHYADANLGGTIRLSYSLIPANGSRPLHSEVLEVTVGSPIGTLLRPEVLEAQKNPDKLQAEAALNGATVRVTTPQILPSDEIKMCFTGDDGVGTYCETKPGNTFKTVDFDVPAETVGANIQAGGRFITVQYWLIRGGRETPSPALSLELLPPTFQQPVIQGHSGDTLNTGALVGTELVMAGPWHFAQEFQRVWLEYHGKNADDTDYERVLLDGELVGSGGVTSGISTPALVSELRTLKNASELELRCWVSFNRSANKTDALMFPVRKYTVQHLTFITPTLTVHDSRGQLANNATTYDTSVTLKGKATANQQVRLYENNVQLIDRPVNASGDWSYTRTLAQVRSYAYRAVGLYDTQPSSGTTTIHRGAALSINTGAVTLNQRIWLWRDDPNYAPHSGPGVFTRSATGGRTPYTYRSNNEACARVNSQTGAVSVRGNGSAYITVADADGNVLGYTVSVGGVKYFMDFGGGGGYHESGSQASGRGGRLPSLGELREIYDVYGGGSWRGQAHQAFWSTDSAGFLARYGKNLYSGGEINASELGNLLTLVIF